MANSATNVSVGKPQIEGSVYAAPIGSTLPTDATTALDAAFKCLGYVSDAGVTNSDTKSITDIKAWGGDVVKSTITEHADKLKYKLIECLNVETLKHVYGSENVSGTLATGITIKSNSKDNEKICLVVEMILNGTILKRIVVPNAQVTEVADIVYKDDDAIGYDTTASCYPDDEGNPHYEYIKYSQAN